MGLLRPGDPDTLLGQRVSLPAGTPAAVGKLLAPTVVSGGVVTGWGLVDTSSLVEGANTLQVLSRLRTGLDDVSLLVIGDSTGDGTTEWVYMLTQYLAAQYPTYTVIYHLWDATGGLAYDTGAAGAATTIQTGSGPRTLHVWNCSVSGQGSNYTRGFRWQAAVVAPNPDLVLVSHGHNEGTSASGSTPDTWRTSMMTLTESVSAQLPLARVCLVLQNPRSDASTDQQWRARAYREIAGLRGYGVLDAQGAFLAQGSYASLIGADFIHPNAAGSQLWVDEAKRAFQWSRDARPRNQGPSLLTSPAKNLLVNGSFAAFTGAVPDSWTTGGAPTVSKDARAGWVESANGYGVRIQATSATQTLITQDIPTGLLDTVRGNYVTLAVRMKVVSGQSNNAGRVQIGDNIAQLTSIGHPDLRDGYHWAVASKRIDPAATLVRARIYADTGAVATADVTVDSAHLVVGPLPRITI